MYGYIEIMILITLTRYNINVDGILNKSTNHLAQTAIFRMQYVWGMTGA